MPFFVKAIVIALKEFKTLNASIDERTNEIILKNYYHIGIATNTNEGLIVPVIKHADQKQFSNWLMKSGNWQLKPVKES